MARMAENKTESYGSPAMMTLVRLLSALVPGKGRRKRLRREWINRVQQRWLANFLPRWRRHYDELEATCRERAARGEKLRVLFLVMDASMFSAEPIFAEMRDDPRWEPSIAIIPDRLREAAFAKARSEKAFRLLSERYPGYVRHLQDPETGTVEELRGRVDLVFTSNPYPDQSLAVVAARELGQHALIAYIPYSYGGHLMAPARRQVLRPEMSLFWRVLTANPEAVKLWGEANPFLKDNLLAVGYPKMDRLETERQKAAGRPHPEKVVVLSPHHSIDKESDGLTMSNFLKYSDLLLKLPHDYPQVKFVFRPHPLLRERLSRPNWWGPEKTAQWFDRMASAPNVECQDGGDYFATFATADALIHDCGSFLPEFFYTLKPQCFLVKDPEHVRTEFSPFGHHLLDHVYTAREEADIRRFLDEVVLQGNDRLVSARKEYARDVVCINHPHAAGQLISRLAERFGLQPLTRP